MALADIIDGTYHHESLHLLEATALVGTAVFFVAVAITVKYLLDILK